MKVGNHYIVEKVFVLKIYEDVPVGSKFELIDIYNNNKYCTIKFDGNDVIYTDVYFDLLKDYVGDLTLHRKNIINKYYANR